MSKKINRIYKEIFNIFKNYNQEDDNSRIQEIWEKVKLYEAQGNNVIDVFELLKKNDFLENDNSRIQEILKKVERLEETDIENLFEFLKKNNVLKDDESRFKKVLEKALNDINFIDFISILNIYNTVYTKNDQFKKIDILTKAQEQFEIHTLDTMFLYSGISVEDMNDNSFKFILSKIKQNNIDDISDEWSDTPNDTSNSGHYPSLKNEVENVQEFKDPIVNCQPEKQEVSGDIYSENEKSLDCID